MKTYSELILALPGETYESFIKGIGKLFEIGQHFVFEVYNCMLLPNAVMGQKEDEIKKLEESISRREKLLSNENYVNKAPANIVELDRKKLAEEKEKLEILKNN